VIHELRRRIPARAVWTPGLNRLTVAWAFAGVADALVAVSLAGSLFFNLSPAASRDQVLLYLVINMAPFALLAPFIGPAIDRYGAGHRLIAAGLFALRGVFAAALAFFLFDLTLYFFALALLIAGKASGVTRQALVPGLVSAPDQLLAANARLARLGTIAAAIGGAVGAPVMALTSPSVTLGMACAVFVAAAAVAMRLPTTPPAADIPSAVAYEELNTPTIVATAWAFTVIRAAVGFFVVGLAFALRRASEPAWMYGATVAAYGVGTFAGLIIAPLLRRRYGEDRLTAGALVALAVVALFGALGASRSLVLIVATVLGTAAAIGRQGFDAMVQTRAPEAVRGRAFARFETRFQVAWVAGAIVATAAGVAIQVSLAVVAVGLIPAAGLYVRTIRDARRAAVDDHVDYVELMLRRLDRAREWERRGQPGLAMIELGALVDVARATDHLVDPNFTARLEKIRATVVAGGQPEPGQLAWALARANDFLAGLEPGTQGSSSGSTDVEVTTHCDERGANVKTKWEESSAER
jgi:predicted MFS family arabinose efflux permease